MAVKFVFIFGEIKNTDKYCLSEPGVKLRHVYFFKCFGRGVVRVQWEEVKEVVGFPLSTRNPAAPRLWLKQAPWAS